MSKACKNIFQKILDAEIPCQKVYEDERVLAFRDINPKAPVHVLLIPKKAIDMVQHIKEEDEALVGHLVTTAAKVAKQLGIEESGYRLVFNNGKAAGQEVFHLHLHLLGGRPLGWPPG